MHHDSLKDMTFYFLQRIDYNQTWEEIEYSMGYDFGDFNLGNKPEIRQKITRLAKQNWIELQGYFNKDGN